MKSNPRRKKISTIIFDLGNVLINFDLNIAVKKLAKFSPLKPCEILEKIRDSSSRKAHERGMLSNEKFYGKMADELKLHIPRKKFEAIWSDIFWRSRGMEKGLLKLKKQGYRIAILSDTSDIHDKYELRKYSIIKEADRYFTSFNLKARKAEGAEIFRKALKKLGASPQETLFIDDMPANVRFAKKAGIRSVLFKNKEALVKSLKKFHIYI